MKSLHTDIQKMIKDMRSGKKVLADDALVVAADSREDVIEDISE